MFVLVKLFFAFFSLFSSYSQGLTDTPLYNYRSERCCSGKVYNFTAEGPIQKYFCCGTDLYKQEHEEDESVELVSKCCRNKLHSQVNRTAQCCGTELFDNTTQACYHWSEDGFHVVPLLNDRETEVCGTSLEDRECYDPNVKMCCSGVLYPKAEGMYCCGEVYYNLNVSICCYQLVKDGTKRWAMNTSLVQRDAAYPDRTECCAGVLTDPRNQECCGGVVVDHPENFTKYFATNSLRFFNNPELNYYYSDCCGTQLLTDEETQLCVDNDHVVSRENWNQVFCAGQLQQISGDVPLNVYCVDDQLLQLAANEWICLVDGNNIPYNETKQVCGDNELIDRTEEDVKNNRTSICYASTDMYPKIVFPDFMYRPPLNHSEYNVNE